MQCQISENSVFDHWFSIALALLIWFISEKVYLVILDPILAARL